MNATDVILILILAGAFLVGFFWGLVRAALSIAAFVVAFLLGASLREPVGGYLATQWTNFSPEYSGMVGFAIASVPLLVLSLIVIQVWTRGAREVTRYPILDDVLGGLLGASFAILLVAGAIIVLGTFYGPAQQPVASAGGEAWTAELYVAIIGSRIGSIVATTLVPLMGTIFGAVVPEVVREAMS